MIYLDKSVAEVTAKLI